MNIKSFVERNAGKLRRVVGLVLVYYAVMSFLAFTLFGCWMFIDFPCSDRIESGGCYSGMAGDLSENTKLVVGISSYMAGACGGGCWSEASNENKLVPKYHKNIVFERNGENLIINGQITLKKNETWQTSSLAFNINPWVNIVERATVKNSGIANCIASRRGQLDENSPKYDFLLITGSRGTSAELSVLGIISFFALLAFFIYLGKKLPKPKQPRWKTFLKPTKAKALIMLAIIILQIFSLFSFLVPFLFQIPILNAALNLMQLVVWLVLDWPIFFFLFFGLFGIILGIVIAIIYWYIIACIIGSILSK